MVGPKRHHQFGNVMASVFQSCLTMEMCLFASWLWLKIHVLTTVLDMLAGWLAGTGWLPGWLGGWPAGWLAAWLAGSAW